MKQRSHNGTAVQIRPVSFDELATIKALNLAIFGETRVINRYDRRDLIMLLASVGELPVGFKVGYGERADVFYSAKGGVVEAFRRRGIASRMLDEMMRLALEAGYSLFAFESFPSRFPEMTALAAKAGFEIASSRYDPYFGDLKVRFERPLALRTVRR